MLGRDRETREERLRQVDEDVTYSETELDRKVVAKDQIRTIVRALRDNLPAIFPDRETDGCGGEEGFWSHQVSLVRRWGIIILSLKGAGRDWNVD